MNSDLSMRCFTAYIFAAAALLYLSPAVSAETGADVPTSSTRPAELPLVCRQVDATTHAAFEHFVRGCKLVTIFDASINTAHHDLTSQDMVAGLKRAREEFVTSYRLDSTFEAASQMVAYCSARIDAELGQSKSNG